MGNGWSSIALEARRQFPTMISVVDRHNIGEHAALVAAMFRLRARVFGQRLKWDVQITDGMERDRFDDENPVYVIHSDAGGRVLGSLRLLPTTGPTLFRDVFGDCFPDATQLSSPAIWECTRFCVEDGGAEHPDADAFIHAAARLMAALGEIGLRAGIESYLGNFDASMIRVYRRLGCEVDVLGHTDKYGRRVYLGLFPVSESILRRVHARIVQLESAEATSTRSRSAPDQSVPGERQLA
jgi:N-acyl-L-homoserine lactone synthetase